LTSVAPSPGSDFRRFFHSVSDAALLFNPENEVVDVKGGARFVVQLPAAR